MSDVRSYKKIADQEDFIFIIVPTVLEELDKLKIMHRDLDFKEKVKKTIKRIKGYRNQGDLLKGVKVDKKIIVKMLAKEPNFDTTLRWLDKLNNDDRIIASALEIQRKHPASLVILVTADMNLQNKSAMASLFFEEPPEINP